MLDYPVAHLGQQRGALPVTADLFQHYRSDARHMTMSSNLVSQWNDISGNGYHLTESTNKPLWVDKRVDGHPEVRFDGVDDSLDRASFTAPGAPMHFFFVVNQVTWTDTDALVTWYEHSRLHCRTTEPQIGLDSGFFDQITGPAVGTFGLLNGVYATNTSASKLALNNAAYTTLNGRTNHASATFSLGSDQGTNYWANIEVAELIVYDAEKTGADLTKILNYINAQYALW